MEAKMRPPMPFSKAFLKQLDGLIEEKWSRDEFERVQCVWLRVALGLSPEQIAEGLGRHVVTVRRIQESFAKHGASVFSTKPKGGRRRQNLSLGEEAEFLESFRHRAASGQVTVANEIHAALEARIGRRVAKSTVYRMLHRHGWRKVSPRPQHPKQDPEAVPAFKKTRRKHS